MFEPLLDQRRDDQSDDPDQHAMDYHTEQVEGPLRGGSRIPTENRRHDDRQRHDRREDSREAHVMRFRRASRTVF